MILLGLVCLVIAGLISFIAETFWQRLFSVVFMNAGWTLIIYSDPDNRKKMKWKREYLIVDILIFIVIVLMAIAWFGHDVTP